MDILLVQFRKDKLMILHEKKCFFKILGKQKHLKLKSINAFNKKIDFSNPEKLLKRIQGVILGGSGDFYFSGNEGEKEKIFWEMIERISPFVKYLLENDFPTLGICFGHQMLGYFLGEKVIADKSQAETGSFFVFLTKEGKKSPLFFGIPQKFLAQFGHRDSLLKLPKDTKLLAKTKKCKIAAFSYKNRIFGVQFHPELNYKDILFRLKLYPQYAKNFKKVIKNLKPSPFSSKVIKNFIRICQKNMKF